MGAPLQPSCIQTGTKNLPPPSQACLPSDIVDGTLRARNNNTDGENADELLNRQNVIEAFTLLYKCGVITHDMLPHIMSLAISGNGGNAVETAAPQSLSRFEQDFERLELLGRGGFGEVWRCRHKIDGREYAVKAVRYSSPDGGRLQDRVWREVQTWAQLAHPNIVRYHNSWVEVDRAPAAGMGAMPLSAPPDASSMRRAVSINGENELSNDLEDQSDGGVTFGDQSDGGVIFSEPSGDIMLQPRATVEKEVAGSRDHQPQSCATLYIHTELCRKETLQTWINKRNADVTSNQITPEEKQSLGKDAADIFKQCVAALSELHSVACVHRDIKPSNILFSKDGHVQLGDFGLAKVMDGLLPTHEDDMSYVAATRSPTTDSTAAVLPQSSHTDGVGTRTYASPEQLSGGSYGIETDIFALGMLLVELLCPVQTQMERAALIEGLRHNRDFPPSVKATFPTVTELAVNMTHPEPAQRPTIYDILQAIPQLVCEMQQGVGKNVPTVAAMNLQEEDEQVQEENQQKMSMENLQQELPQEFGPKLDCELEQKLEQEEQKQPSAQQVDYNYLPVVSKFANDIKQNFVHPWSDFTQTSHNGGQQQQKQHWQYHHSNIQCQDQQQHTQQKFNREHKKKWWWEQEMDPHISKPVFKQMLLDQQHVPQQFQDQDKQYEPSKDIQKNNSQAVPQKQTQVPFEIPQQHQFRRRTNPKHSARHLCHAIRLGVRNLILTRQGRGSRRMHTPQGPNLVKISNQHLPV